MPALSDHQSTRSTKLLLIGDSGTGKTGALTSLVGAGYKLRIIDMDNGLDSLRQHISAAGITSPDVQFQTFRDRVKGFAGGQPQYVGQVDAFSKAMKAMEKWPDDGSNPAEWDEKTVLVLDSLSFFSEAAFAWARAMNPSAKEPRQWFYTAQQMVIGAMAALTSEAFRPNVIVTAHVEYQQLEEGVMRGFPRSVGQAIGTKLVAYFNHFAQVKQTGSGAAVKREVLTAPTALITLKTPAPKMPPSLPISTALADYFKQVRA